MPNAVSFPPTRWSLIGRVADGSSELVERYADGITRYLRLRFADSARSELDDVIQDVLVGLLERPALLSDASPRAGGHYRYYLATVALNLARNSLRARRRELRREQSPIGDPADERVDNAQVDQAWTAAVLAAAWADLRGWAARGELEAEIPALLSAHLVEGIALRDLAQRYGLTLATCQRRIAKGRTWLQRAITERGLA